MAVYYEAGVTKVFSAATGPVAGVWAASRRLELRELGISIGVAPASAPELLVGRASNTPSAPVGVTGQPGDVADIAGTGILATSWTTAPTVPTNPMRRYVVPNVVGAAIIWTWGPGEMIITAAASTLVVWMAATLTVTYSLYAKWLE